jgi:hypothetical protein
MTAEGTVGAPTCFFNACILRYCLSKPLTLTSLSCSLNAVLYQASRCGTPSLALLQFFFIHFFISIAVLENVLPDAGLQKRATFSTLNVGLDGTGNQTRSTCVASSGTNRSAIHYALWVTCFEMRQIAGMCRGRTTKKKKFVAFFIIMYNNDK